jgi:hypothetical protein
MFSRRKCLVAAVIAMAMAMLALAPVSASAAGRSPVGVQASCGQHSQAWIKAFGYGILHSDIPNGTLQVPAGVPIYHTGIVVPGTRIRFQYVNLDANTTFFISSAPASGNCVVPHEQAVLDTSIFGGTRWGVGALYVAWEDNQLHSVILGTLIVT